MNRYSHFVLAFAGVIILLARSGVTHANNGLRTVALSGQAAPGTSTGVKFSAFAAPVINDRGETAFVGAISGTGVSVGTNSDGIWSEGGGGLKLLARTGSAAPGTSSGVVFRTVEQLEGPVINDAGQTAFAATVSGPGITSANNAGIWSTATGNVALEMQTGSAAPGTSSQFASIGDNFSSGGVGLALNNNGKIAFQATLTTPPINMAQGIWSGGGGSPLSLIARNGTLAPGAGANFVSITSDRGPVMNNSGQVAFTADTQGSSAVWSERGGNGLQRIAKAGDSAPGTAPGVVFSYFAYHPGQNDAGNIGFYAGLSGPGINSSNDEGLWSDSGGTLHLVAREGSPAPGAGYAFAGPFYERVMNEKGEMAFVSTSGIWSEGGGHGLRPVALFNQPIAGVSSLFFNGMDYPNAPVLNRLGQTAFIAPVYGLRAGGDAAIFAEDILGHLHMVVREGDVIDVSNDPQTPILRTVSTLEFVGQSGNNDGRRSGLNDWGQLTFYATFTDRSAGIFVSNVVAVPEPQGVALAVLGVLLVSGQRRSRPDRQISKLRHPACC